MPGQIRYCVGMIISMPIKTAASASQCGARLLRVAEQAPANFYHFILDNEVYATTGGQPVPNAKNVDYAMMARGAGLAPKIDFFTIKRISPT